MNSKPSISVLMSAYNAGSYIHDAIKSIASQSYTDFEFLIVDDGSTDRTWNNAVEAAGNDPRIRLFRNESNVGVGKAINQLFEQSKGDLIARMDADDIAHRDRFRLQVNAFSTKQYDIVGSWMTIFGDGPERVLTYPSDDAGIKAGLLFTSMFSQPTVMIRREMFDKVRYREEAGILEDYDLWTRMAVHGARMHNIPIPLLRHRRHPGQTSSRLYDEQWRLVAIVSMNYLESLGIPITEEERQVHINVRSPRPPASLQEVVATEEWLKKLMTRFNNGSSAMAVIADHWYRYCLKASVLGIGTYKQFLHSPITTQLRPRLWHHFALIGLGITRLQPRSRIYTILQSLNPAAWPKRNQPPGRR